MIANNSNSGVWLYGSGPTFSQNIVSNNSSFFNGGGIDVFLGAAIFNGNIISDNRATNDGGGISLNTFSSGQFSGNRIISNTASRSGGGLSVSWRSSADLTNTVVTGNKAGMLGSGIHVSGSILNSAYATIANNSGGGGRGIYITNFFGFDSNATLTNTIVSDQKVGVQASGEATLTIESILWYQAPLTVTQDVTSVVTVNNQYTGDPDFASDGYHIMANSAAIDRGVDAGVTTDIDGGPRPVGKNPDLGADEFDSSKIYLPVLFK